MRRLRAVVLMFGAVVLLSCPRNHAPDAPAVPGGPAAGLVDTTYSFQTSAIDPDADSVVLRFSWGDGDTSGWSEFVPSGSTWTLTHAWSSAGSYAVRAQARDDADMLSGWSDGHNINVTERPNNPPLTPPIPDGPAEGLVDSVYYYAVSTPDPDGDLVAYRFCWGDGDTTDWTAYLGENVSVSRSHSWDTVGTFAARTQARDELGAMSDWSDSLPVAIYPNYPCRVVAQVAVPDGPIGVCVLPSGEYAYVTCIGADTVVVIRISDFQVVASIAVGEEPWWIAPHPTGDYVYVGTGYNPNGTLTVVRTADNSVVNTVQIGGSPVGIAVLPDGKRVYVVDNSANSVAVIETKDYTITDRVPVGRWPRPAAAVCGGEFVYVQSSLDNAIDVIRTVDNSVEARIPVGLCSDTHLIESAGGGYVYVPNGAYDEVLVVSTSDRVVVDRYQMDRQSYPHWVVPHPDGVYIYVASGLDNYVQVIRTADGVVTARIPVGGGQEGIAADPDGRFFIVTKPDRDIDSVVMIGY